MVGVMALTFRTRNIDTCARFLSVPECSDVVAGIRSSPGEPARRTRRRLHPGGVDPLLPRSPLSGRVQARDRRSPDGVLRCPPDRARLRCRPLSSGASHRRSAASLVQRRLARTGRDTWSRGECPLGASSIAISARTDALSGTSDACDVTFTLVRRSPGDGRSGPL